MVCIFDCVEFCIRTYLPREGPETYSDLCIVQCLHSIDAYQPREGPETRSRSAMHERKVLGIATYLPREGSEITVIIRIVFGHRYV